MTRRLGVSALVLFLAALFIVPSVSAYYTDWLWFREVRYEGIFLRTLNAQATVFAATFAAVFIFLYAHFAVARRALRRPHVVVGHGHDGRPITVDNGQISALVVPGAGVLGLLFGLA